MGKSLVLRIFGRKSKCWTNENDLMMVLEEMLSDHQVVTIHSEVTMNVFNTFQWNPSDRAGP